MTDPVREFLRERGASEPVIQGGAEALLETWERAARDIAQGYPLGLDDYLNDMDGRELLDDLIAEFPYALKPAQRTRLAAADQTVRAAVAPVSECLWGSAIASREGWTPERNWWYFNLPRSPGQEFRDDLGNSKK